MAFRLTRSSQPGIPTMERSRGSGIPCQLVLEVPKASNAGTPGTVRETLTDQVEPMVGLQVVPIRGGPPSEPPQPTPNEATPTGAPEYMRTRPSQPYRSQNCPTFMAMDAAANSGK